MSLLHGSKTDAKVIPAEKPSHDIAEQQNKKQKLPELISSNTSYIEVLDSPAREDLTNPADLAPNIVKTRIRGLSEGESMTPPSIIDGETLSEKRRADFKIISPVPNELIRNSRGEERDCHVGGYC